MKPQPALLALLLAGSPLFATDEPLAHLYVPDGQIISIPVKIYVSSTNLGLSMKPRLQLAGFRARNRTNIARLREWEPFVVAPNQSWTEKVEGQSVTRQGTLLIFDLNRFEIGFPKSTARVTPVLTWQPPGLKGAEPAPMLVGQWVYLGRRWVAGLWTLFAVGLLVAILAGMAVSKNKPVLHLISGDEGYMSLWRTQLAAWTVAVGSMVFLFGLIQLDVPRIPETLVVLMGMSVATGSLSAIAVSPRSQPPRDSAKPAAEPTPADKPRWSDLITAYNPQTGKVILSVSKAQMVFWTGIILALFVVKSVLSGELWEVPWELVTLTGVSQAGYVGDKALQRRTPR